MSKDLNHAPQPGPGYWGWRCLVCDEPVKDHPDLIERLVRKMRRSR